jgi:uncharacterized protein YndB with AHSA1/START domain
MTTPADEAAPAQSDALSLEFDLRHAPEKVWRALTDPALLAEWLLPAVGFDLTPGAQFAFKTDPHPGWDGTVECRVVEIDAYRKLSYTWAVGPMGLDTIVTFVLAPTASGTRLSVVQSGFKPHQRQAFGGARYGWTMMGGRLTALLESMR